MEVGAAGVGWELSKELEQLKGVEQWWLGVTAVMLTAFATPGSWLSIVHVVACGDGHEGLQDHDASRLSVTEEMATARKLFEVKSEPIEQRIEQMGGGGREEALKEGCSAILLQTRLESARAPLSPFVGDLSVVLLCFVWLN